MVKLGYSFLIFLRRAVTHRTNYAPVLRIPECTMFLVELSAEISCSPGCTFEARGWGASRSRGYFP